jgi:hypothetical protein
MWMLQGLSGFVRDGCLEKYLSMPTPMPLTTIRRPFGSCGQALVPNVQEALARLCALVLSVVAGETQTFDSERISRSALPSSQTRGSRVRRAHRPPNGGVAAGVEVDADKALVTESNSGRRKRLHPGRIVSTERLLERTKRG